MERREKVFLFHIFRKNGESIFLHPFDVSERLANLLERSEIQGRYGQEPRVESLTLLRNELYRRIEIAVKRWLSDVRFIPKFLSSTAVFLITYFVTSYLIRDPVPVIDELAFSFGAAIAAYVLMGRKDISSDLAARKRIALRAAVDRIVFRESDFVCRVEEALHQNESCSMQEVIRQIIEPREPQVDTPDRDEAAQFIRLLENSFNFTRLRKEEKMLKKFVRGGERGDRLKVITRIGETKKLDFPLYAVYKSFKKTVTNAK